MYYSFFMPAILFFFLISCSKPKDNFVPVTGRILSAIDSTLPFSKTSFKFYNAGGPNALGKSWEYSQPFVTDSLGYVNTTINLKEFGAGFSICWTNGNHDNAIQTIKISYEQKSVDFRTIYAKF